MLVKEYRIYLPLSVAEYRIAQLYMIQKKSRTESSGTDSGVEILKNEPYEAHDNIPAGQYTYKIYHVGSHIPSWVRACMPATALMVYEEAWNAYPYTRTRYTTPFIERFSIDVETRYFDDDGKKENIFDLSKSELRERVVDVMDMVADTVGSSHYVSEEDPKLYSSTKTGRGPLKDDWIKTRIASGEPLMCAYKLCRVEFAYWGMQSKIEKFIHDTALRQTMLRAHRQAWAWQDEWYGLTIDDIRALEDQAKRELNKRMKQDEADGDCDEVDQPSVAKKDSPSQDHLKLLERSKSEESIISGCTIYFDASNSDGLGEGDMASVMRWCSFDDIPSAVSLPYADGVSNECSIRILLLVFHGGSVFDSDSSSRQADISTLKATLQAVLAQHYQSLLDVVAVRLVACPYIAQRSVRALSSVCPYWHDTNAAKHYARQQSTEACYDIDPALIPLLASSDTKYRDDLSAAIDNANAVYRQFLASPEGTSFDGKVCVVGDLLGGILAFDACMNLPEEVNEAAEVPLENGRDISSETLRTAVPELEVALAFHPSKLFMFGSPVAHVLLHRQLQSGLQLHISFPKSIQVYNIYYAQHPCSARVEPFLYNPFCKILPVAIPRYKQYPLGYGESNHMSDCVHRYRAQLCCSAPDSTEHGLYEHITNYWLGDRRIDYALYSPDSLSSFPSAALPALLHSSYWESVDVCGFVSRQLLATADGCGTLRRSPSGSPVRGLYSFPPNFARTCEGPVLGPIEHWLRKRTAVLIRNLLPNHRGNDVIVTEDSDEQVLRARFAYGALDYVHLVGEQIDIYIMTEPSLRPGEWTLLTEKELTDKHGCVTYVIPNSQRPSEAGLYPVKFVVRGDHTYADIVLAVVPPRTQAVVFSIDGSFSASMSVSGKDPRVRAGVVDLVRFYQQLSYLIIYITARPDMQMRRVASWLAAHNFPHALLYFNEKMSTEPLRQKSAYLSSLVNGKTQLEISAAYGSSKDVNVYTQASISPANIYVLASSANKPGVNVITGGGYAQHLLSLQSVQKPASGNGRLLVDRAYYSLIERSTSAVNTARSTNRSFSFDPEQSPTNVIRGKSPFDFIRQHSHRRSKTKKKSSVPGSAAVKSQLNRRSASPC